MAHVSANVVQQAFRGRNDDGSETGATWTAPTNENWTQAADEVFRVRMRIEETAGGSANNGSYIPQYSVNGGAFITVNDDSPCQFALSAFVPSNTATTQQIGSGDFVPGEVLSNTDAGNVTLENQETEMEYSLWLDSAQLADGDIIQIRATDGGDELDDYINTPSITASVEAPAEPVPVSLSGITVSLVADTTTGATLAGHALTGQGNALSLAANPAQVVAGAAEQPVTLAGISRQLSVAAQTGNTQAAAVLQGTAAQRFIDALAGSTQAGEKLAGEMVSLALSPATANPQAGTVTDGQAAGLNADAQTGQTTRGQALSAGPVSLSLRAMDGTLVLDDSVPVVLLGEAAGVTLATQAGQAIYGVRVEGGSASLIVEAAPGQIVSGADVPLTMQGQSALMAATGGTGFISAGAMLEGAAVSVSAEAESGHVVTGHVLDGDALLLSLMARQAAVFSGLVLAVPIRRTQVRDVSRRYRANPRQPRYSVTAKQTRYSVRVNEYGDESRTVSTGTAGPG